jgi:membrane protein implicated in regulation of membrane protease activity
MTAIGTADAQVVVGLFVLIGTLAGLFVQNRRTHRENRSDHADTSRKVDRLLEAQGDIAADVREVKAEVRHHGERLRHLEAVAPTKPKPAPRKKAAS